MTFKSRRKKRWEKGMILGAGCFGFLSGVVFTQQNTSPVHASEETVAFIHEDPVSRIITNAKDTKTYQENSVNKIDSMVSMAKTVKSQCSSGKKNAKKTADFLHSEF